MVVVYTPAPVLGEASPIVLLALVPGLMCLWFPAVLAVCSFIRDRSLPLFATAVTSAGAMVLLVGWITPASNQVFREQILQSRTQDAAPPARGLSELSLTELAAAARLAGPDSYAATRLGGRIALVVSAPLCCLLGARVRQSIRRAAR